MNNLNSYSFGDENHNNCMAYCKVLFDSHQQPMDIILVNAHPSFRDTLKATVGNSILASFSNLFNSSIDLLNYFSSILSSGQHQVFKCTLDQKNIQVKIYPLIEGELVLHLVNNSSESDYYDELTGLYNRSYFEEEVRRLNTIRQLPISLIVGDVNGLRKFNELYSYPEGDRLLKELASILKKSCRSDDIVSRWDGDEFRIFLPKTDNDSAQVIINRIYRACKKQRSDGIQLNLSLGYATKTSIQENINQLFVQAHDSMNKHKLLNGESTHNAHVHTIIKPLLGQYYDAKEHAQKVLNYALSIGQALNLSEDYLNDLKLLAVLYNIGTVGITEKILSQPKELDDQEWIAVKKHPEMGFKIVKQAPHLAHVADSILYHHERWDGTGYPSGLSGNSIPLFSRILAVADAYDAMTSPRAYREMLPTESAIKELKKNSGTQFDPHIVNAFLETLTEI